MSKQNRGYEELKVVAQLRRKSDITFSGKVIRVNVSKDQKGDIGIHSKGKIDFLKNYCGYSVVAQ